jgi:hypothetical protein
MKHNILTRYPLAIFLSVLVLTTTATVLSHPSPAQAGHYINC